MAAALAAALIGGLLAAAEAKSTKPPILLIVADDLGYNDIGFQTPNNAVTHTPNLNFLAKGGVVFTNHHVQPFCSPTRAALQTGRHVLRYGLQNTVVWPQDPWAMPLNETFLSENLQDAGYYTAYFGKWHLGFFTKEHLPMKRGFNEQYGYYLGGEDYWDHSRTDGLDWHRNDTLETRENGTYSADLLGLAAATFITKMSTKDTPWYLYLPFQSVHSPLEAEDIDLAHYPDLSGTVKTRAGMISALDRAIGNVTHALVQTEQLDDVILLFTSDNGAPYGAAFDQGDDPAMMDALGMQTRGPPRTAPGPDRPPSGGNGTHTHGGGGGSNYPLSGWKHYVFEGGVRSCSFIYSSLLKHPGTTHHGLFHAVDWLPTLTKLVGVPTTKNLPLDGVDIWSAIQSGDPTASPVREIPVEIAACGTDGAKSIVDGPQAALIVGDLKIIVDCFWRSTQQNETAQVYNITADAAEMHDLAASRPELVTPLLDRLAYWEAQSVVPYSEVMDLEKCGQGKPQGTNPPHWDFWC